MTIEGLYEVQCKRIKVTKDDLLALTDARPFVLLPAPGVRRFYQVLGVTLLYEPASADYVAIDQTFIGIQFGSLNANQMISLYVNLLIGGAIQPLTKTVGGPVVPGGLAGRPFLLTEVENQPICLALLNSAGACSLTKGDGSLDVVLYFMVENPERF